MVEANPAHNTTKANGQKRQGKFDKLQNQVDQQVRDGWEAEQNLLKR